MFYPLRGGRGRGLNLSGQNPLRQTKKSFVDAPFRLFPLGPMSVRENRQMRKRGIYIYRKRGINTKN